MSGKARPAYVDDVDESSGKAVRGSRRSASTREKPKVSQRTHKSRRTHSDDLYLAEQGHGQAQQHLEIVKDRDLERRMSTSSSNKSPHKNRPPPSYESRQFPKLTIPSSAPRRDDSTYYGLPTPTGQVRAIPAASPQPIPLAHRPRAFTAQTYPRPQSYHATPVNTGNYGPPLSMSAFYNVPPLVAPSYPPPSPSYMRYAAPQGGEYFPPQPPPRTLQSRFDPIQRTSSAFETPRTPSAFEPPPATSRALSTYDPVNRTTSAYGTREVQPRYEPTYFDDGYISASEGATATIRTRERRNSIRGPSTLSKVDQDYLAMPPPSRPTGILRRPQTEYTLDAMDVRYREPRDDYREEERPRPRAEHRERERERDRERDRDREREDSRPRRPNAHRNSVSYDLGPGPDTVRLESATSNRRRQTWYEQPASSAASSGYEDKLHQATSYQEDVGGPTVPLTADLLKRQQRRHGGSSRSTKSSASRDESDYKKSATTRTTRSGSGNDDENVTIKVTGQARVMVGGAQIDCNEGGEIEIKRQQQANIRSGSERTGSSEYSRGRIEDRKSRISGPVARAVRLSSQSGRSYTRVSPQYPVDKYPMDSYI